MIWLEAPRLARRHAYTGPVGPLAAEGHTFSRRNCRSCPSLVQAIPSKPIKKHAKRSIWLRARAPACASAWPLMPRRCLPPAETRGRGARQASDTPSGSAPTCREPPLPKGSESLAAQLPQVAACSKPHLCAPPCAPGGGQSCANSRQVRWGRAFPSKLGSWGALACTPCFHSLMGGRAAVDRKTWVQFRLRRGEAAPPISGRGIIVLGAKPLGHARAGRSWGLRQIGHAPQLQRARLCAVAARWG